MAKKSYEPLRVRPKNATPELAVKLHENISMRQIADAWGISKNRVWQLIKKANSKKK